MAQGEGRLKVRIDTREVFTAQRALDSFQKTAVTTERTNVSLTSTLVKLSAGFGGLAVIKGSISLVGDFDAAVLKLGAISNATTEELAKLEAQSRSLGATSVFSAKQASDAQLFLAQAGFKVNEILTATPGVLKLAQAGTLDLATAADIASNVLGGMRLKTEQLNRVNDVLAATAANSNTNILQLGDALSYAAPIAAIARVPIEAVSAAIGTLGDAGLQSTRAGTGLLGVIRQLSNITPQVAEALANYGLATGDVDIKTRGLGEVLKTLQRANISTADSFKIFGSEAAPAALILAQGADRVAAFMTQLENAQGAADKMAARMSQGLNPAILGLQSAAYEAVLSLDDSSGLTGAMTEVIKDATGVINIWTGMGEQFAESNNLTESQTASLKDLADTIKFLGATTAILITGRTAMAAYAGTIGVLKAEQAAGAITTTAYNVATGGTIVKTEQATLATLALNKAMRLTPYGVAIGVASALAGVILGLTDDYDDLAEKTYEAAKAQETLTKAQRAVAIEEAKRKLKDLREEYSKLLTSARTGFLGQPSEVTDKERAALELLRDKIKDTSGVLKELQSVTTQSAAAADTNAEATAAQGRSAERSAAQLKLMRDALGAFNEVQAQVQYDLADPTTQLIYQYDQRQRVLDDALAAQAVSEANYNQASLANTQLYEKAKTELMQQEQQRRQQVMASTLGAFGQLFGNLAEVARQGGEKAFQDYKNLASAQAAINAALAISNVFGATSAVPVWLRFPLAASVAAVTGASIAQIQSQEYTPARALGGQVTEGQPYLVGERGPELFVPNNTGTIQPNAATAPSQPISVTNVFQISTGVQDTVRAELAAFAPEIEQRTTAAVQVAIQNGGSMARAVGRRA